MKQIEDKKIKEGFYGVYKPSGPTSHDIVEKIRKISGVKKVGHAGTLDPMAEGILVVAIGKRFTKEIDNQKAKEKEYIAEIELGKISDTDDKEGIVKKMKVAKKPTIKKVKKVLEEFSGEIIQIPPIYSAVKISGTASYKLARKGEKPRIAPRKVLIKEIELINYQYPKIELKVVTGPGVYIRALARDLGKKLSVGGILTSLIRSRVGEFDIDNCYKIKDFKKKTPHV